MRYLLLILFIASCEDKQKDININDYVVSNTLCERTCLEYEFKNFHNNGKSWGTGSSSMNGLTQGKIFDRILSHCKDFFKDKKCCYKYKMDVRVYDRDLFENGRTFYGHAYGVCKINREKK